MKLDVQKLKQEMARKLINQKDLAALYGCTQQRIQQIINKEEHLTTTIGKLAQALGCDVLAIIKDEGGE